MAKDLGENFDPEFYKDPPPQYSEDLDDFLLELSDLLNKYHLTIGGTFDLYKFSHYKSKVSGIQRYDGKFATINRIHEENG